MKKSSSHRYKSTLKSLNGYELLSLGILSLCLPCDFSHVSAKLGNCGLTSGYSVTGDDATELLLAVG